MRTLSSIVPAAKNSSHEQIFTMLLPKLMLSFSVKFGFYICMIFRLYTFKIIIQKLQTYSTLPSPQNRYAPNMITVAKNLTE